MDHLISFKGIQPMIWETDERKRNVNNECTFSVPEATTVNVGDRIINESNPKNLSVYEITNIIESKPSLVIGRNYIRVNTKWYRQEFK